MIFCKFLLFILHPIKFISYLIYQSKYSIAKPLCNLTNRQTLRGCLSLFLAATTRARLGKLFNSSTSDFVVKQCKCLELFTSYGNYGDKNNIEGCEYDKGDCCGLKVNTEVIFERDVFDKPRHSCYVRITNANFFLLHTVQVERTELQSPGMWRS